MNPFHQVIDPSHMLLAGPLTNRAESLIRELITVSQYGAILVGIVVVIFVFYKTKSVVPTSVAALVSGFLVWLAFNINVAANVVGGEIPGNGSGTSVPSNLGSDPSSSL